MKTKYIFLIKIISILICVVLIASFCGCVSNNTKPSNNDNDTKASDVTKQEDAANKYVYTGSAPISNERPKISILSSNGGSKILGFKDMAWWQEVLKRANVELVLEEIDSSAYENVVRPRLASGVDLPDIIKIPGRDDDMSYINSGIFIELSEYYEKYGYNLKKQFEKHKNLKSELTTPDGKIYYVPTILTSTSIRTPMINMLYLEKLGMKYEEIKTIDDFYNYLVAVKNQDVNGNGDASDEIPLFMRSGMIQLWSMYWGLDLSDTKGFQVEDNGKVICGYADDRYLEFLTFFNKLYKEGLLYSEFATANLDTQNALFSNNQIGCILHYISNCTGYSLSIDPEWDFDNDRPIMKPLVPPLKGPYGHQVVYGSDTLGGDHFGITRDCKDPETVFCFIDYLYSEEVGKLTWLGFEGKDYNVVNGEYVFSDEYKNNVDNYLSKNGHNCSILPTYQLDAGKMAPQCKEIIQDCYTLMDNYLKMPSINFSYKLKEENEVLQAYSADLNTYFTENLVKFIMGVRPLSEWDNYIAEMEKMHLSDVIAVYQASIDRGASAK